MILGLRLFMTPLLIATVTLIGRRWGPGVSGRLIGFPLTSGPVLVMVSLGLCATKLGMLVATVSPVDPP